MTRYILFLRGINVGGKNRVPMAALKQSLSEMGLTDVVTYINSGNVIFSSDSDVQNLHALLTNLFEMQYAFPIQYALISEADYKLEFANLPAWWFEPMARKDVLLFTESVDRDAVCAFLDGLKLNDERVHVGQRAIFWGKCDEKIFLKMAYHKVLIQSPIYKQVTIRNANTFRKMLDLLS